MITVGADVGKHKTKLKWKGGTQGHLSKISFYREVRDNIKLDDEYIIVEYEGKKYLAGLLAEREGESYLNSLGIYKSNIVTLLNLLIELSRLPDNHFNVVLGNPFIINTKKEREALRDLVIGNKTFKVNDKEFKITISNVGVAPEGLAAYFSFPVYDDCNILDFGSTTINAIAIRKKKMVDKKSHTFSEGFETLINSNHKELMQYIKYQMEKKWDDGNYKILCVGGKSPDMFEYVRECYPHSNAVMHTNYEYANSIGLYELGVRSYEANYIPS